MNVSTTPRVASPSPWLCSAKVDGCFILLPPFLATLVAIGTAYSRADLTSVPPWAWLLLIVGVDVAHVYSTFFRTYLGPARYRGGSLLYRAVPLVGWVAGYLLYLYGSMTFWRVLAYLAVYHFVRQQYGFLMIYSRSDGTPSRLWRTFDKTLIYLATGYPLLYWHTHLPRRFNWFIDGDFLSLPSSWLATAQRLETGLGFIYLLALGLYAWRELKKARSGAGNWPKNLVMAGTALSWYVGIVALDQDLPFTVTNIVSHGIPYIALIWLVSRREQQKQPQRAQRWSVAKLFTPSLVPLYLLLLLLFAYVEEGLWDGLVWREHGSLFHWFAALPQLSTAPVLAVVVPTLALPQITHYLLDGFIWRLKGDKGSWLVVRHPDEP